MKEQTRLVHGGMELFEDYEYVNPPVYRASTVLHPSFEDMLERAMAEMTMTNKKPTYGTYGSPTHHAFYRALCALEGPKAVGAWSYPTGLAACTIPLTAFLKAGDHCLWWTPSMVRLGNILTSTFADLALRQSFLIRWWAVRLTNTLSLIRA